MIDFLDELGNFKQKNFYILKCKFFLHFTATDPNMKMASLHFRLRFLVLVYKPPPKITKNYPLEPCTLGMLASPKLTLDYFHIQQ